MFGFIGNKLEQTPFNKAMEKKNDEEKLETFKKMGEISYQNIFLRAQEILSDEDNERLDELAGGNNPDTEMFNFLKERIPNFSDIIKEEVEKTQDLLEKNMSEEKNQENKNEVELEPEDVDIESLNKLGKLSLRKISNEILNTSEGEEKENFEKLLETGDEEKVVSYIEKNYPELLEEKNEETQDDLEFLKSEIRKNLEEMKKSKNQNE